MEDLRLVFISKIGKTYDGKYEYKLYFSKTPELVWAEDYAEQVPSACSIEDLLPNDDTYHATMRCISPTRLELIQDNSCFSFQDCIDGIIKLCWVLDKDGKYYGLPFASTIEDSEIYLNKFSFELGELIMVDKEEINREIDSEIFDYEAEEELGNNYVNPDEYNDDTEEEDLEKLYNGDF